MAAIAMTHSAAAVAERRMRRSDTSLPIITQGLVPGRSRGCYRRRIAYNPRMLARLGAWLDRAAFKPASLPDDLVTGFALLPVIVAGLVIFKVPAAQMLAVGIAAGAVGVLVGLWFYRRHFRHSGASPLIAAFF